METTILHWGYTGIMESHYYITLGLYWDNGKLNGNYYIALGLYWNYGKSLLYYIGVILG